MGFEAFESVQVLRGSSPRLKLRSSQELVSSLRLKLKNPKPQLRSLTLQRPVPSLLRGFSAPVNLEYFGLASRGLVRGVRG